MAIISNCKCLVLVSDPVIHKENLDIHKVRQIQKLILKTSMSNQFKIKQNNNNKPQTPIITSLYPE